MWSLEREVGSGPGPPFLVTLSSPLWLVWSDVIAESQQGWSRNYPLWLKKSPGQRLKTLRSVQTFFRVRKSKRQSQRKRVVPWLSRVTVPLPENHGLPLASSIPSRALGGEAKVGLLSYAPPPPAPVPLSHVPLGQWGSPF